MQVMKPTSLRKDIYNIFRGIIQNHSEVEVMVDEHDSVVIIPKSDYTSMKELLYLQNTGVLDIVLDRMDNESAGDFLIEDAL